MFDFLVSVFLGSRLRGSDEPFCINLLGKSLISGLDNGLGPVNNARSPIAGVAPDQ